MAGTNTADFLSAQLDDYGRRLTSLGFLEFEFFLTPRQVFSLQIGVAQPAFMQYAYLFYFGEAMVPNTVTLQATQYGAQPINGVLGASAIKRDYQTFMRITQSQPVNVRLENLTNLNQQISAATFFYIVSSEEDFLELERRLKRWQAVKPASVVLSNPDGQPILSVTDQVQRGG